jgi:hypothetical protein
MKKARIILLCMLVLGTVGGVVAFKANAFEARRGTIICYSSTVGGTCISPYACVSTWTIRTTILGTLVCYTSYVSSVGCNGLCTSTIRVTPE